MRLFNAFTTKILYPKRRVASLETKIRFLSSSSTPSWKVAIVGSGPSGCYTAKYLNSALPAQIDVLERLPTPYGLVRNGVAPDHPEVKNVQNDFDQLLVKSNIQFYGNVTVGEDISLNELREMYDIVVLSYGCESDRPFDFIKNSKLKGILSAREFVSWYNGHVDFEWVGPLVKEALMGTDGDGSIENNVVVVGHGNVALDCARILAKTREELDSTDITTCALATIQSDSQSKKSISVIGRRGHIQGAFTIKELRELTKLQNTAFIVRKDELKLGRDTHASRQELKDSRPRKRMDKLLTDAAQSSLQEASTKSQLHLRFLLNPIAFESDDNSSVSRVVCERTRLIGDTGSQSAEGTGEMETLQAQLVRDMERIHLPRTVIRFSNSLHHR